MRINCKLQKLEIKLTSATISCEDQKLGIKLTSATISCEDIPLKLNHFTLSNRSAYFVVKTALGADTERKCQMAKKTASKERKPLITPIHSLNMFLFWRPIGLSVGTKSDAVFFQPCSHKAVFGRKP